MLRMPEISPISIIVNKKLAFGTNKSKFTKPSSGNGHRENGDGYDDDDKHDGDNEDHGDCSVGDDDKDNDGVDEDYDIFIIVTIAGLMITTTNYVPSE